MRRNTALVLFASLALVLGVMLIPTSRAGGTRARRKATEPAIAPVARNTDASRLAERLLAAKRKQMLSASDDGQLQPNAAGLPNVLNSQSATSAMVFTAIGGRGTQFSEVTLLANNDGREDFTADQAQKVDDFSFVEGDIDQTFTRTAISEHTKANGFDENVYYYGDSVGNFWVGTDTNPGAGSGTQGVDTLSQVNIPTLINTGTSGGFTLAGVGCTDDQVTVTGIAVNPVADLSDFGAACGTIGEVVYVSIQDTGGCSSNAAGQPIRTRILAFAFVDGVGVGAATPVPVTGVKQIFSSQVSNSGIALDDDGSLYFHLVDLVQFTGGAVFKAKEQAHVSVGCPVTPRINRTIGLIPTPTSINSAQGTAANPILINLSTGVRLTNYSGPSTAWGNIVAIAAGPGNSIYAAVSRSFVAADDAATQNTEGRFPAPSAFGAAGTPSMIISFADVSGVFDSCTTSEFGATLPIANGIADPALSGLTLVPGVNNFRIFAQGNGPNLAPAAGGTAIVPGTPTGLLNVDMQIDFTIHSGITVDEEGTVYVISGGTPAGMGLNPSPGTGEILAFPDCCAADRRADFIDLRGNVLPNPPASSGNIGDGDSDRFDHIYLVAPLDQVSRTPTGLSGLARGFLRYTNRLAPNALGPGVTLGVTQTVQGDDATTSAPIFFDNLDPGHQVAGGDDQNTPFRGDDNDGQGNPLFPGALNGGFEFTFGGPVGISGSVWNGFFLNSNGSVTFGAGDTDATPTVGEFRSGLPKIASAWADLNPDSRLTDAGTFPVQALGFASDNAFKVRWINVPEKGSETCTATATVAPGSTNTFAVTLFDDGTGIDENANQPLNPANPIGNNLLVGFDLQEGPTDLRFVRETNTTVIVGGSPRRPGSGNFFDEYSRMDLLGTALKPVIAGYSIGFLDPANPPGLCETDLGQAALSADIDTFGVVQSQTANVASCLIGEGTEPTIYEIFNQSTVGPDFDLRFEGNDASFSPVTQADVNRSSVGFFGVGSAFPANPIALTIATGPFVTTPTTTGIINAIGPVQLNIVGVGFYPNEVTTVCVGESTQRPGKTVSTSANLTVDVDGNGIPESLIVLSNVQVISENLIKATLSPLSGLPGSPFPLAASGGNGTITVTTTFTSGDNNIFGPFTRSSSATIALGTRAPVVTQVTPSSGDCGAVQTLAIQGGSFQFTQAAPVINATVTDVIATEIGNPANVIHATSFTVVDANNLNATFNFGGASSKSFLIQAVGTGGTSRNMTVLPAGAPPPLGNEAGNAISFSCGENLQFNAGLFSVTEDVVTAPITIVRASPGAGTVTVDFATSDGTASQVGDYTATFATVTFGPGETSKVINVPITEDAYVEGNEVINLTLSNATGGASVGGQSTTLLTILNDDLVATSVNPIDDPTTFVNQHYHDFLNRQGDAPGVAFWTSEITSCGVDPACIEVKRINVSAAFFLSIEFQESGFNVIRTQRVAFGKKSADPATRYQYLPFLKDAQQVGAGVVVGQPGADALLEANKQAYATQVVTSTPFTTAYPLAQTASQYVDALFATATVVPTAAEQTAAITAFGAGGTAGRTAAFRSAVDSTSVRNAETNAAFVLMQYYGYLRRNPTDAPDNNDVGYQFWLAKLNAFGGNFINAELVKAFISSAEYRQRFGTP